MNPISSSRDFARERRGGWICLALWASLIISGIVAKRVFGHPDHMVLYHLPAAVFLVLAFYKLSGEFRANYRQAFERARANSYRKHDGHHSLRG